MFPLAIRLLSLTPAHWRSPASTPCRIPPGCSRRTTPPINEHLLTGKAPTISMINKPARLLSLSYPHTIPLYWPTHLALAPLSLAILGSGQIVTAAISTMRTSYRPPLDPLPLPWASTPLPEARPLLIMFQDPWNRRVHRRHPPPAAGLPRAPYSGHLLHAHVGPRAWRGLPDPSGARFIPEGVPQPPAARSPSSCAVPGADTAGSSGCRRARVDVAFSRPSIWISAARYHFSLPWVPRRRGWAGPSGCCPGPLESGPLPFFCQSLFIFVDLLNCYWN
jgi:hypothetical protein